ncbi:MAG TPA: phosphotransferase family protein [Chloroflexia bacterium]|nr:phosphotransferase family protein [Chloroflexia bacterium]
MSEQNATPRSLKELDEPNLQAYLAKNLPETQDAPFSVKRYPHGYSNLTFQIQFGTHDMVLRRPPIGANIKSGHDMEREYRVLSGLAPIYSKAPRPVLYCEDSTVTGAPFYLMERVDGVILRNKPPEGLTPEVMGQISRAFIENLADIHALDYTTTELKNLGRPGGYVNRQITGWRDRYARAKTDEIPSLERAGKWLEENAPADSASCLIHNDYKYDNVVLDRNDLTRIIAVLDWEMATIGDPLMDLGTTLAYWIDPDDPEELQKARDGSTLWPGNLNRAQLVQQYALKSGREVGNIVFYYVYGLYKIAVIAQQIYARYKQGYSTDERFGRLIYLIKLVGNSAALAIEKQRIDQLQS